MWTESCLWMDRPATTSQPTVWSTTTVIDFSNGPFEASCSTLPLTSSNPLDGSMFLRPSEDSSDEPSSDGDEACEGPTLRKTIKKGILTNLKRGKPR